MSAAVDALALLNDEKSDANVASTSTSLACEQLVVVDIVGERREIGEARVKNLRARASLPSGLMK